MKKNLLATLLAALLCAAPVSTAYAADAVGVTLPEFPVTLNGQTLSNDYSKYPFLVYRGITYFPMTYHDCRLLGLETTWTEAEGLGIKKGGSPISEYAREVQTTRNKKAQTARITGGRITVNGKTVNNSREQYPLLEFRDVTYFPLTWRFAVEEFGWDYHFDMANGLIISNPAAAFMTTDEVGGQAVDEFAGTMGMYTDIVYSFSVDLNDSRQGGISTLGFTVRNLTGETIRILPSSEWEYQIYRVLGGREELVYRRAIPIYSGELPSFHYMTWGLDDTYWNDGYPAGLYTCRIAHPDAYTYQIAESGEVRTTPAVAESGNGAFYNFTQNLEIDSAGWWRTYPETPAGKDAADDVEWQPLRTAQKPQP